MVPFRRSAKWFLLWILILFALGPEIRSQNFPTLDGSSKAIGTSGTTNLLLSTSQSSDIVIVYASFNGGVATSVTSISDSKGLTWSTRGHVYSNFRLEEWFAKSSDPLSSDQISIFVSNPQNPMHFITFGVSGINFQSPFDAPLNSTSGLGINPIVQVTTSTINDMLIGAWSGTNNGGSPASPASSFSSIATLNNATVKTSSEYKVPVAPAVQSIGFLASNGGNDFYAMLADSLQPTPRFSFSLIGVATQNLLLIVPFVLVAGISLVIYSGAFDLDALDPKEVLLFVIVVAIVIIALTSTIGIIQGQAASI